MATFCGHLHVCLYNWVKNTYLFLVPISNPRLRAIFVNSTRKGIKYGFTRGKPQALDSEIKGDKQSYLHSYINYMPTGYLGNLLIRAFIS